MDVVVRYIIGTGIGIVGLICLYTYISYLQSTNEELEQSNAYLTATLESKQLEAQKTQKELEALNTKLNAIRAQARKGEDKLNEAISKSNDQCGGVKLSDDVLNKLR